MATCVQTAEFETRATVDAREALACEVRRGLTARRRSLSPWMFYDAEGSRLFERITDLPEYYPSWTGKSNPGGIRGCDHCASTERQIFAIAPR